MKKLFAVLAGVAAIGAAGAAAWYYTKKKQEETEKMLVSQEFEDEVIDMTEEEPSEEA